jgi:hypothetical protein
MEAHKLESEFFVAASQLRLPIGAQSERRMATPDGVLPEMRERRNRI